MKFVRTILLSLTVASGANFAVAQTWTQTSAPSTNWTAIACSADGSELVAVANGGVGPGPAYIVAPGPIYLSTNSGATWTQATNAPTATWCSVASSADGTKLVAAISGGGIYQSVDSGLSWTQNSAPSNGWISVASSADGNKLAALARIFPAPDFYTSSDAGNTWSTNTSPYDRWKSLASSADGSTLLACGPSTVLTSTNSGSSWTTNFIGNGSLSAVATSADGRRLLAAASKVYLSTNSGNTWSQISAFNAWQIASSADGSKLVAAGNSLFYVSTNFGVNWVTNLSPSAYWASLVSSADGSKLAAAANGGGVWTLQNTPTPALNLVSSNGALTLSWIVPSTNFVLQQSAGLSGWSAVTNPPVLNLTNLQNEVVLSPTNASGFYRLKTP